MKAHSLERLRKDLNWLFSLVVVLVFGLTAVGLLETDSFLLDRVSHFYLQYCLFSLVGAIILLFQRRWCFLTVAVASFVLSGIQLIPYLSIKSTPSKVVENDLCRIRLLTANVLTSNSKYEDFLRSVRAVNPDLVMFQEIDQKWDSELSQLEKDYPHYRRLPRGDNFGIGVFSKLLITDVSIRSLKDGLPPNIIATIAFRGHQLSLFGIHTLPPMSKSLYRARNLQLNLIADLVSNAERPAIVMGDLNTSMWSWAFKSFIKKANLVDSRLSQGVFPTWPSGLLPLLIPIDHILTSGDFHIESLKTVDIAGSDHRGLILDAKLTQCKSD